MTEAERTCVSFRDQSADWSWESVIPLHKGRGERIATAGVRTGFAMTPLTRGAVQIRAGGCGERTERCRWQKQRSERVAAVKILSVRRKAAQKFWAPQQDHRPLRKRNKRCNGRATARVAPTEELQGVQWAGDRKGRPYERVTRGAVRRADVGIGPYGGLRGMCGLGIGPCGSFLTGREWYVSDFGGGG